MELLKTNIQDLSSRVLDKKSLDYFDTYSLVTRITFILMLLALVAVYDLEIHQMNVKAIF